MSNLIAPPPPPPVNAPTAQPAPPPTPGPVNSPILPPDSAPPPPVPEKMPPEPDAKAPWYVQARYWLWKYVGVLVMAPNPQGEYVTSLGRAATAALLLQAMVRWGIEGTDIPESMLQTLFVLLAYCLGSQGVEVAHRFINKGGIPEQQQQMLRKGPLL